MSLSSFFNLLGVVWSCMKQQNDNNTPGWPLIIKISALLFLQLSKLKKIKCPYFFNWRSIQWDMAILWFCQFWDKMATKNPISDCEDEFGSIFFLVSCSSLCPTTKNSRDRLKTQQIFFSIRLNAHINMPVCIPPYLVIAFKLYIIHGGEEY